MRVQTGSVPFEKFLCLLDVINRRSEIFATKLSSCKTTVSITTQRHTSGLQVSPTCRSIDRTTSPSLHAQLPGDIPALPWHRCPSSVRRRQTLDLRRLAAEAPRTAAACTWSTAATACRSNRPASTDYTASASLPTIKYTTQVRK